MADTLKIKVSQNSSNYDDDPALEGEGRFEIGNESEAYEADNVYPIADVRVAKDQYSLLHIKRLVETRKELVIDPDYQREGVWSQRQRIELIESILMGIPLPVVYLFEDQQGKKQVVDGRQRITAIIDFLNDKFALKELRILKDYNSKTFSGLPEKVQGIFEDYQIQCYIIQPPTPERVKYDIFDRVNRGGTKLNAQEMRNALYRGLATSLIETVCKSEEFLKATDVSISSKRMRDRYAALRIIAFWLLYSHQLKAKDNLPAIEYRSDMDDFLAKVMIRLNGLHDQRKVSGIADKIKESLSEIYTTLGTDAFRFPSSSGKKRAINMPLMETLVLLFMLDWKRPESSVVRNAVEEFKADSASRVFFAQRVDSSVSVKGRFKDILGLAAKLDPKFHGEYDGRLLSISSN